MNGWSSDNPRTYARRQSAWEAIVHSRRSISSVPPNTAGSDAIPLGDSGRSYSGGNPRPPLGGAGGGRIGGMLGGLSRRSMISSGSPWDQATEIGVAIDRRRRRPTRAGRNLVRPDMG